MTVETDGGVGARSSAGDPADAPAVAAALAELAVLDDLPVEAHADVYEQVQQRLQDAMVDVDEG